MEPPKEPCAQCRLRRLPLFRPNTPEQTNFIQAHKKGEITVAAGDSILEEGHKSDRLFTLLSGWAFRYKALPDGRRQILNFLLPGDLVGLQSRLLDETAHGVEALTDCVLCAFTRGHIWEVFRAFPTLAFDLTWLCAHEERIVDEALLSVGRRSAAERMAWLFLHIWERAQRLDLVQDGALVLPITQMHIADALGLSLVHTNRTIQLLRRRKLFELSGGVLSGVNPGGLRRLASQHEGFGDQRPLY